MTDPREAYGRRGEALEGAVRALESASRRLSVLRSTAFLFGGALWVAGDLVGRPVPFRILALAAAVTFVALVVRHRRVRGELRRVEAGLGWVREGQARLARDWARLPEPLPPGIDPGAHPWAGDLDLFGHASLASLLGRVRTPPGMERLSGWLLESSGPGPAMERQAAVRELARDWAHREAVAVEASLVPAGDGGPSAERGDFSAFLTWCSGTGALPAWLNAAAWVLPLLLAAAVVGDVMGWIGSRAWVGVAAAQSALAFGWARGLHRQFALASAGLPGLRRHHGVLALWEGYGAEADLLRREVERLGEGDESSSAALRRLDRLAHLANVRLSTVYPVLAVAFLWDVHVVRGLLGWRDAHGARVQGWMEAMGTLEALAALATLAGDHPEWCWPRFREEAGDARLSAESLGHPLLPSGACVRNDVELGPPGTVLLVTGSNMSGKSTLLRAVGLAAVMAEAGLPVCAGALTLTPVRLFTSMRVRDSLEAGVSYFMAELLRLRALLDVAREPGPPALYLVDEILQGTNSEERRVAGRRLIRHLLRSRAIGAVTTHDLELHRDPEVEAAAVLVHFRESLDDATGGLGFDYRLRQGLATTRNALRLAERVGLTDPGS